MKARSFSHVGITVSDFNRAVQFYWDVFGCPLVGVADTPPDRVRSVLRRRRRRSRRCKIGWIRVPGGGDARDLRVPAAAAARRRSRGTASA